MCEFEAIKRMKHDFSMPMNVISEAKNFLNDLETPLH